MGTLKQKDSELKMSLFQIGCKKIKDVFGWSRMCTGMICF